MTNEQTQVILTGVLGDGSFQHNGDSNYAFTTSSIHKEYVEYKASLLGDMTSGNIRTSENNGYKKGTIHILRTRQLMCITEIATDTLENNLNRLDDLGIALWFYDDGSFHQTGHFYNLCTHAFSLEEHNDLIVPFLSKKLDINVKIRPERKKDGRLFYYCSINKCSGAENIAKLLQQFPVECYKYKLGLNKSFENGRDLRWIKYRAEKSKQLL